MYLYIERHMGYLLCTASYITDTSIKQAVSKAGFEIEDIGWQLSPE
jgi:hypothetical protein